jgi:hypothetical protein
MARPQSEWHKAMSLEDLRVGMELANSKSLNDNYWLRCMGLNDRTNNRSYHENRLFPSPLIIPVQFGPRARTKGFKLRLGSLHSSVMPDVLVDQRSSRRFRDQDEIAVFT